MDLKALQDILLETLTGWGEGFVAKLPSIIAALLILAVFGLASRQVEGLVERLVERVSTTEAIVRLCASMARHTMLLGGASPSRRTCSTWTRR